MAIFRIYRFDPQKDRRPRYVEFEVEVRPGLTILDVLQQIKHEIDPSLTFRRSCKSAICGSCAVRVNGRAMLACETQALTMAEKFGKVVIDPLKNMPVIRDLVVDMNPFWKTIRAINPWLIGKEKPPEKEHTIFKEQLGDLKIAQECIMCGSCYSDCTVAEVDSSFLGPAALAKEFRFLADVRDANPERLKDIVGPHGIWDCAQCVFCNEHCPKSVKPLDTIMRMRQKSIEIGLWDNQGARHALAFQQSVKKGGKVNEAKTAIGSLGFLGLIRMGPLPLKMALKGKSPKYFKRPAGGIADVKKIVELVEMK